MVLASATNAAITLPDGMTLEGLREALCAAGKARFGEEQWSYVEATQDGTVVFNVADKLVQYGWEFVGNSVSLSEAGTPVVKRERYEAVSGALTFEVRATESPRKFRVRVFGTGFGRNFEGDAQWYVPSGDEGVGSAIKVFGGARVHWNAVESGVLGHVPKVLREWMNSDHNVAYLSEVAASEDGLTALLTVDEPNVPEEILEGLASKRLGLSVEAFAEKRPAVRAGRKVVELVNWHHPDDGPASVAIVSHPALRGEVLSIAAAVRAKENDMEIKDRAHANQVLAAEDSSDEAVAAARKWLRDNPEKRPEEPPAKKPEQVAAASDFEVQAAEALKRIKAHEDELDRRAARIAANEALTEAKLPAPRVTRVLASLDRLMAVDATMRGEKAAEWVKAEIEAEQKVANETVKVQGAGAVHVGPGAREKAELRIESLLGRNDEDWAKDAIAKRFHSGKVLEDRCVEAGLPRHSAEFSLLKVIRETCGYDFLDLRRLGQEHGRRVQAAFTTSGLADALENVQNKRFLGHFENPMFGWRTVVRVVPLSNFRKQERIVRGNYPDLATVTEGTAYPAMTSWGDRGHGYTPAKRGGIDTITWETYVNDDVGIMQDQMPSMAYVAARTLNTFVFNMFRPTATASGITMDYDSSPLYQATVHSNRGTAALNSTTLIANWKLMYKYTDQSSSKRLAEGAVPRYLIVPVDKADTAFNLLKARETFPGGSTADYEWIRRLNLMAVVVPHWTDSSEWVLAAPNACEIGFVLGQEEPELFMEGGGAQNIGDFLTHDRQKVKVRHAYGGTIIDHTRVRGNT